MKKSFLAASLLIAGIAIADTTTVDTEYVLGVLPVNATGKQQVILSIPWVAEGTGENVAVSNLVKTAGLPTGEGVTILKWYKTSGGGYATWTLADGQWAEASGVDSASRELPQGDAIVLSTTGNALSTVYVIGQVGTNSTVRTTIPAGDGSKDVWVLVAPPCALTSSFDFNSYASAQGGWAQCEGDEIIVDAKNGLVKKYTCSNVGTNEEPDYKWVTSIFASSYEATIPGGCGVWYRRIAANAGSAVTIIWSSVPSAN